jgi:large subunit ribosomal protein L20
MARVTRGVVANRRHKKVLKKAKGYYGARSRIYRVANQAVTKAGQYAYRDRRVKKRVFPLYGSLALMLRREFAACPTAD